MDNNPNSWYVNDNFSGYELNDIKPISQRLISFYSRKKFRLIDHHTELFGAIEMLNGIDYHYENIEKYIQEIDFKSVAQDPEKLLESSDRRAIMTQKCKHEIVAYLNRLYQFQEFFESELTKNYIKGITIASIKKSLTFRHNLTGKRKLDYDSKLTNQERTQARYSDLTMGTIYDQHGYIVLQITGKKGDISKFCVNEVHEQIMNEAFSVFAAIFSGLECKA